MSEHDDKFVYWWRYGSRSRRPRDWWALVVVFAICLAAVLLEDLMFPLFQAGELNEAELQRDVCIREFSNSLGARDPAGSIIVLQKSGTPTGDEALYLAELEMLAAAHSIAASGGRYGFHSHYRSTDLAINGSALATLCEKAKACRSREFRLLGSVRPELAARIVFKDIVRAETGLRTCREDPRYNRSQSAGSGP